jgi:hypothetical protein
MDAVGLTILLKEIEADCVVIQNAAHKAQARLRDSEDGHLEACAYELARLYNVLEKILERICSGFENHFDKRGDYHERLIQRLALTLPGIRPAFIPQDRVQVVRELKGFRHVVRHAYDLEFREARVSELVDLAAQIAAQLPAWSADFGEQIRSEQNWK